MIYVHEIGVWFDASTRKNRSVSTPMASVRELAPDRMRDHDDLRVFKNLVPCSLDDTAQSGDHVTFMVVPRGIEITLAQFLAYTAVLTVSNLILTAILAPSQLKPQRGSEASSLYGFSGPSNNRTEGEAMPIYYGLIRAGGQVVNEFVENRGTLGSYYNVLLSFGEGPIQSICGLADTHPARPRRSGQSGNDIPQGLLVNGIEAADLDRVEMHVRTGTLEQEPIVGFDRATTTKIVDQGLDSAEANNQDEDDLVEFVVSNPPTTSEDDIFEEYGVPFTMAEPADSFTVTVDFTAGLSKNLSSGSIGQEHWGHAVRYIELDGAGDPITTGGPDGDGWLRLPRAPRLSENVQGAFSYDFRYEFLNIQTYSAHSPSTTIAFDVNDQGTRSPSHAVRTAAVTTPWTGGAEIDEMTVQAWGVLRPGSRWTGSTWVHTRLMRNNVDVDDADAATESPIFEWWDDSNTEGFRFSLGYREFELSGSHTKRRIVPQVFLLDGTTEHQLWEKKDETGEPLFKGNINQGLDNISTHFETAWHLYTFTYKANATPGFDRVRIYADGEILVESYGVYNLKAPTTADLFVGAQFNSVYLSAPSGAPTPGMPEYAYWKGAMDELAWWSRELTPNEVKNWHNSGLGRYIDEGTETDLVGLWHFDPASPATGTQTLVDSSGNGNDLSTQNPAGGDAGSMSTFYTSPFKQNDGTTDLKRGRYLIEVVRSTASYTNNFHVSDSKLYAISTHLEESIAYTRSPMLAVRILANDQIQGSTPTVTALLEGRLVPVWNGQDAKHPTLTSTYSNNPAWCALDQLLNASYGLGDFFEATDIDLEAALEWAEYCDEKVYDLTPSNKVVIDGTSTSTGDILDILYDGTNEELTLAWVAGTKRNEIPAGWVVGKYVAFSGLDTPIDDPDILLDVNKANIRGLRIKEFASGSNNVLLEYPVATYGAPWADGTTYSSRVGGLANVSGEIEGRESRYEFNAGLDEDRPAWDVLMDTCASGRAVPLRVGTSVSFGVQNTRPPIETVSAASQIRSSFEMSYSGPDDKENTFDIEFMDSSLDYERSTVSVEHPSVQNTTSLSRLRRKSLFLLGVTRRSQALRHGRFLAEANHRLRRQGSFQAAIDSVPYRPGDVLRVASDLILAGVSGRFASGSTASTVKLDREVVLGSGITYSLSVRPPGATEIQTREVTSTAGTYAAGDDITVSPAFTTAPIKSAAFILHEEDGYLDVQVTSITIGQDLVREVSFIEYDPEVYVTDEADDLPELEV